MLKTLKKIGIGLLFCEMLFGIGIVAQAELFKFSASGTGSANDVFDVSFPRQGGYLKYFCVRYNTPYTSGTGTNILRLETDANEGTAYDCPVYVPDATLYGSAKNYVYHSFDPPVYLEKGDDIRLVQTLGGSDTWAAQIVIDNEQ